MRLHSCIISYILEDTMHAPFKYMCATNFAGTILSSGEPGGDISRKSTCGPDSGGLTMPHTSFQVPAEGSVLEISARELFFTLSAHAQLAGLCVCLSYLPGELML